MPGIQTFRGFAPPRGAVRWAGGAPQTADRHPDVPQAARAELLLRRQDALHPTPARRGHPLFPVAPPPIRQEPVPGHAEGAVRGQRRTVRGAAHPRRPRLVPAPSGGATELRRRQLHRPGRAGSERHGATRRLRTAPRRGTRVPDGGRPLRVSAGSPAPADRAAGRGAGGRVRQADPGHAGGARGGARQPRLPARPVRGDQGQRRPRAVHVPDRHQQVLEGEPVFPTEQPHRHHARSRLLVDLRVYRGRSGRGVRSGAGRAGPGAGAGVV